LNDTTLLTLLAKDKKLFDRFSPLVKDYVLSRECLEIYKTLGEYYRNYPSATKVDWGQFSTFFFMVKGKTEPKKATFYRAILDNCAEEATRIDALPVEDLPKFHQDVYKHYVKLDYLTRITNTTLRSAQGLRSGEGAELDTVQSLLDEFKKEVNKTDKPDEIFVPRNLSAVVGAVTSTGLEWPLEELNISWSSA
jgi:hypothetical protein